MRIDMVKMGLEVRREIREEREEKGRSTRGKASAWWGETGGTGEGYTKYKVWWHANYSLGV
jgi:hypothetical protein